MSRLRFHGFSLLELLCALGVLSLVLAIALPRIPAVLQRLAVDQSVRRLANELELARVKAISRNTRVRTIIDVATSTYVVSIDSEGRFSPEGASRHLATGVWVDPAESTRVAGGRISITYVPRGNTADNATIVVRAGPERKSVVVSAAGRVRTE